MSAPYAGIRERLLYNTFSWLSADLELQAWSGGHFNEQHVRVSDLIASGGVPQSKSQEAASPFIRPGGYASSNALILPGTGFSVGASITFLTMNDRASGSAADPILVLFIDDADGLPFVANGLDYVVEPDWLFKRAWWRP
jgi:hypothetical protein